MNSFRFRGVHKKRGHFLVAKAKRQLHDSLIARKRRDLTDSATRELTIWLGEKHVIANIEEIPSELRVQAFLYSPTAVTKLV